MNTYIVGNSSINQNYNIRVTKDFVHKMTNCLSINFDKNQHLQSYLTLKASSTTLKEREQINKNEK